MARPQTNLVFDPDKHFHGPACKNCSSTIREKKERKCVACLRERSRRRCALNVEANRKRASDWYAENKERGKARTRKWYSENKERVSEYHREYRSENKEEVLERKRLYREANAERVADGKRDWYRRNPDKAVAVTSRRRARQKNAPGQVTASELRALRESQPTCRYCGVGGKLTYDHIIPLTRGGEHAAGNLQMVCKSCNSRKSTMTHEEFIARKHLAFQCGAN